MSDDPQKLEQDRFDFLGQKVLRRRTFDHKGMKVDEVIIQLTETTRRIMWAKHPIESTFIDGVPNPIAHKNTDDINEHPTRLEVEEVFDNHWKLK